MDTDTIFVRTVPGFRSVFWPILVAVLCVGTGCKKKKYQDGPEEQGSIYRDAGMSGPSDPRYGSQGAIQVDRSVKNDDSSAPSTTSRSYKNCRKPVPVTSGDRSTPEGTLYLVFQALLEKDDNKAFAAFYDLIDSDFQSEKDARRYWFASARKNNSKAFLRLVYSADDPSYDVCTQRPEGPDAVRIFVGKSPPVGSNPPYVLKKKGEKWLLKSFTPH